jgi:tRNA(Ile)-lysidine synthase
MDFLPDLDDLPGPPRRLWLAFSGGLDSTVLLHRLAALRAPGLRAVHVHHGLQAAADSWARHCRALCRQWQVPLTVRRVTVNRRDPQGPEAAARAARYAALRGLMRQGDALVTAHHLDDQAETVLLRLLRGSGLHGLAGMAAWTDFGPGGLWRPLLQTPREQLYAYAARQRLRWIEAPHNADPRLARSYLRREIFPRLRPHWPQASASLARAAQRAAEAVALLDVLAEQDLAALGARAGALDVRALRALPPARRNNLLRFWLVTAGWPPPEADLLNRIETEVLQARADAQPRLRAGPLELRRYRDRLYAMGTLPPPPVGDLQLAWRGGQLQLPDGCGELRRRRRQLTPLSVRFAVGGARLRLQPERPSQALRNLFQQHGVPPWVRERVPLIYQGGRLLAVADLWCAPEAQPLGIEWRVELPGLERGDFHRGAP